MDELRQELDDARRALMAAGAEVRDLEIREAAGLVALDDLMEAQDRAERLVLLVSEIEFDIRS